MTQTPSVQLLGPPQIHVGDQTITTFRSSRVLALLGFLAVNPGRRSRDQVAEALWPDRNSEPSRHNLRQTLLYVKQVMGSNAILNDRTYLELNPDLDVDVCQVLRLRDRATSETAMLGIARQAAKVYRGPFLQSLDDDWLPEPRAQISNLYVGALLRLAEQALDADPRRAIDYLDQAIAEEPLSDGARALKIDALRRMGEHTGAQREFNNYRNFLLGELGIAPSPMVEEALRTSVAAAEPEPVETEPTPDNFDAVIKGLAMGRRPQQAVELACALLPHWVSRGAGAQGRTLLEFALTRAGTRLSPAVREAADFAYAELCVAEGNIGEGQQRVDRLLRIAAAPLTQTRAHILAARIALVGFNPERAEHHLMQARSLAHEHRFTDDEVETYRLAPRIAIIAADRDRAEVVALEAIAALERLGDEQALAGAYLTLAYAQHGNGNDRSAKGSIGQALSTIGQLKSYEATAVRVAATRLREEMGDHVDIESGYRIGVEEAKHYESRFVIAVNLTYLGDFLSSQGRHEEAIEVHLEALGIRKALDERLGLATSLRGLGRAYLALGQFAESRDALTESARLFLAADAIPGHASSLLLLAHLELRDGNQALSQRVGARAHHLLLAMTQVERSSIGPRTGELLKEAESLALGTR
jgi:DNA-binding SARP family transcriptional activator